jgi:serine/threonine protein kinase
MFAAGDTAPASPPAATFPALPALPGYEFLGEIGHGAMGVVYKARQMALDRLVAVKVLQTGSENHPGRLARFEQEARSIARLRHANIVIVFDFLKQAGCLFLVMELLENEDLGKRIQRQGPLDEVTCWGLVKQAAAGLAHAAQAGIVHRDIKPSNLILVESPPGSAHPGAAPLLKIMDFGLALMAPEAGTDQPLTNPGMILGTPAYMAPEQFSGSHVDWRADLYSLGTSVVFLLTGRQPFAGGSTLWDIMQRKMAAEMALPPQLSADSQWLLRHMLARAPEQRFPSYQQLLDAIDQRFGVAPPPNEPRTVKPRTIPEVSGSARARRRWWIGLGLGMALLVAAFVWWYRTAPPPGPPQMQTGTTMALFNGKNLAGWLIGTGTWQPTGDEEGGTVLAGTGIIRRPLPRMPHYRLLMGVDLKTAQAVDIHFGLRGSDAQTSRYVLRVTPQDVLLGQQQGDRGDFHSLASQSLPAPSGGGLEAPYRELRVDRAPHAWYAYYHGQLIGSLPAQADEVAEFRLRCEGGPAFFETIEVIELLPPAN